MPTVNEIEEQINFLKQQAIELADKKEYLKHAKKLFDLKVSFKEAGFTDDEAYGLVVALMHASGK